MGDRSEANDSYFNSRSFDDVHDSDWLFGWDNCYGEYLFQTKVQGEGESRTCCGEN